MQEITGTRPGSGCSITLFGWGATVEKTIEFMNSLGFTEIVQRGNVHTERGERNGQTDGVLQASRREAS